MLTFLPIFAIFAAALFSSTVAWGQATDRYAKVANQLKQLINSSDYAGIQTNFNKQMDAALPLEKSHEFFKGLTQQLGRIQKLGEPQSAGGWMVFPAQFEKGLLDLRLALDGSGKIAGLTFKPRAAVKFEQAQMPQSDRYTKIANQLKESINAGDYAGIQTHFNREMDAALPPDKSREFFKGLALQMGKIQKLGKPEAVGGAMVFPAEFEKGALDMQVTLDDRGQIAGLNFTPPVAR